MPILGATCNRVIPSTASFLSNRGSSRLTRSVYPDYFEHAQIDYFQIELKPRESDLVVSTKRFLYIMARFLLLVRWHAFEMISFAFLWFPWIKRFVFHIFST